MSPWFYGVETGRFERYPVDGEVPAIMTGFPFFQFVPSRGEYFVGGSAGVAFFDPAGRAWSWVEDTGPRPSGYDHGGCYDEGRNRVYLGAGSGDPTTGLFVYDIATATWTAPASDPAAPGGMGTANASVFHDVANDVVTVFHYVDGQVYTYLPDAGSWSSRELPRAVLESVGYPSFNAFYDRDLNAYFVYVASDSSDVGVMWAYRYRNVP
jgi:hypothetical protein